MAEVTKRQFAYGAIWKIIEQFSSKGVSLLVSIILVRILVPEDFGLLALTAVFTNFSDLLIDGGFSTALIRKREVDELDFSCVLSISVLMATILYILQFSTAPVIAGYYSQPLLIPVMRVLGLVFFMQAFSAVRIAIVVREMRFRILFYCNIIATLLSGVLGVIAALMGLGVWSMVLQRLVQQFIVTLLLYFRVEMKIPFKISLERVREMLNFSIGVVGSSFINYLSSSIYNLVIGKRYSVTDLGYFDKGSQLPMQASLYTFGAMSSVLLPTISSYQHDLPRIKAIIRKVMRMTSYLIFPMMVGMALISKELVVVLFTDKWLPIVRIMQYGCIYYLATPFMLINIQVFFALGNSSLRVKTEIIRLVLLVSSLIVFSIILRASLDEMALIGAVVAVISSIVTSAEVKKLINYGWNEMIRDIIGPMIASCIMGVFVYLCGRIGIYYLNMSITFVLIFKVSIGFLAYFFLSLLFRFDSFYEVLGIFKKNENL